MNKRFVFFSFLLIAVVSLEATVIFFTDGEGKTAQYDLVEGAKREYERLLNNYNRAVQRNGKESVQALTAFNRLEVFFKAQDPLPKVELERQTFLDEARDENMQPVSSDFESEEGIRPPDAPYFENVLGDSPNAGRRWYGNYEEVGAAAVQPIEGVLPDILENQDYDSDLEEAIQASLESLRREQENQSNDFDLEAAIQASLEQKQPDDDQEQSSDDELMKMIKELNNKWA